MINETWILVFGLEFRNLTAKDAKVDNNSSLSSLNLSNISCKIIARILLNFQWKKKF